LCANEIEDLHRNAVERVTILKGRRAITINQQPMIDAVASLSAFND